MTPTTIPPADFVAIPPLLIATGNPHKVEEIGAVLGELGIACEGFASLGSSYPEPEENGATFVENARLKALGYARESGRVCLADDSGLEIDALDGRPGVHSARYAADRFPPDADRAARDSANNARVLEELDDVTAVGRVARFVCVLCIASPDGRVLAEVRGTFEGRIGSPEPDGVPRGSNGFGYDPLFLVGPDCGSTSAELAPEEKNRISHRGQALVLLAEKIRDGALNVLRGV